MSLFIREAEARSLITMPDVVDALEEVFRLQGLGDAVNRPRQRLRTARSRFQVMPASAPSLGVLGWKAYGAGAPMKTFLYSTDTGEFLAVLESGWLGAMRTGAASGVATRHLARADASTVGIIGSGDQSRTQLEAICAVRTVTRAVVFSRTPANREAYAQEMTERLGIPVLPVSRVEEAVRGCDVVTVITNSPQPVLFGEWLDPGTHVNAAGGNSLSRTEVDPETVRRAALVTADSVEQARMESGDLLWAVERGVINWEQVVELGQVVCGRAPGRTSNTEITLFESHGLALWDVAIGNLVYRRARERGAGIELPL